MEVDLNKDRTFGEATPQGDGTPDFSDVQFDDRYKDAFHGLAYIGALTGSFEWLGHKFVIHTLTQDEELAAALIVKDFEDTLGQARAYATALAALCVDSVDGEGMPTPVGTGPSYGWAYQRFNYAKARWYRYTIDKIYEKYLELEDLNRGVLEELGKASGSGVMDPNPTPGLKDSSGTSTVEDF